MCNIINVFHLKQTRTMEVLRHCPEAPRRLLVGVQILSDRWRNIQSHFLSTLATQMDYLLSIVCYSLSRKSTCTLLSNWFANKQSYLCGRFHSLYCFVFLLRCMERNHMQYAAQYWPGPGCITKLLRNKSSLRGLLQERVVAG